MGTKSKRLTDEERLEQLYDIYDGAIAELHRKNEDGEMKGTSALAAQIAQLQTTIEKQISLSGKGSTSESITIGFEGFDIADMVERLANERVEAIIRERGL